MTRRTAVGITTFVSMFAASAAVAATVTRGPYLQLGTELSVVVRWRTDVASDSRVSYGPAPGSLTFSVDDAASTTEHAITITGLSPDTYYYYSVGTTAQTLAGDDSNHFFLTSPAPGTPKATRIWVLGDSGTANADAQAVRNAYYAFTGSRHTDLWLMLGDNAYPDGTDAQYQAAVFAMYPEMLRKSVLWPTFGNHDGSSADSATQSGPYYDIFSLPRNGEAGGLASGTEAYYSFDYGNIHFIVLDSFESSRSPTGAMLTWLTNDLASTTQDWIVAYWHHPPYSKGSHDSDTGFPLREMRQNALPILEAGGVDLVLSGHSHSYERSFLIDGHYGASTTLQPDMILDGGDGRVGGDGAYQKPSQGQVPHEGAVYTVAGTSGHLGGGTFNHPVMFISFAVLGSVVLDVQGSRLDATFVDSTGVVRDTFTIAKDCGSAATVDVSPTSATVEVGAAVTLTAVPRNAGGEPLSGCAVTWTSSADGTATVSSAGLVTGVAEGTATVTASAAGASGQSAITVVASTNVAPIANAGPNLGTTEGTSVVLTASFTDPDTSDVHTATVDWGDGSPVQPGVVDQANDTVTASHTYANDAVYIVTLTVNDGRGGVGQDTAVVTVSNVPPSVSAGGPYSGPSGSLITMSGSAGDPGADVLTFAWDFDYDGTTFQVDATGATVQHSYAQDGVFTAALRVSDDDTSTIATTTVTVAAQSPVVMYLTLGLDATLPSGLAVANEDILAFNGSALSLYFDGSDVGLQAFAIDAFAIVSPTEILISFTSSGTVGGVAMDDSDIVKFTATSLGVSTAGTFSIYFDGSDVGLSTAGEDVDAVELLPNGHLLMSTTNTATLPEGFSVEDEDLLEFTPTSLGTVTTGGWALYFDGSDVGLSNSAEDVDAVAVDASGKLYLSTTGNFAVTGISGPDEDVFVFTPTSLGSTTQGTFASTRFFDGSVYGLAANDVFAIDLP